MSAPVRVRRSTTSGLSPPALSYGELGLNATDGRLFYGDGENAVKEFSFSKAAALAARVFAKNTTAVSISPNTLTAITGWTVSYDRSSNFNGATGVFTAPIDGFYQFNAIIAIGSILAAAVGVKLSFVLNASTTVQTTINYVPLSLGSFQVQGSLAYFMTAGQTMQVKVSHNALLSVSTATDATLNTFSASQLQ